MTKARAVVDYLFYSKNLRTVAKHFNVGKSSVQRWVKDDGRAKPVRTKKQISETIRLCIERVISKNPFVTMREMAKELRRECGINISSRTADRYTKKTGLTLKKAVSLVDYKHDNREVKAFCQNFLKAHDDKSIFSMDEAGFYVGDHPRRGRSKRGQKLAIYANKSLRKIKFSLIMIIGTEGVADYKILSNNFKKADIVSFFTKLRIPTGSTIVMDNLRAHHSKETIDVIKSKGWKCLFTPPYSPRTNPIEKVFGMIKPAYRNECPSISTLDPEEFRETFESVIAMFDRSFESTFTNTALFLQDTIRNIDANPSFVFVGYDKVVDPIRFVAS